MASFNPKVYELSAKAGTIRLLSANSLCYPFGDGLFIVDPAGTKSAAQIRAALEALLNSRIAFPVSQPVTEIAPTTV